MSHSAWSFDFCQIFHRFRDLVKHSITLVLVQHLTSAEEYRELYFVAFFQKFTGVIELDSQVVFVGSRPESDFLQRCSVVLTFFTSLASLALLLIQPLAIIHYPAHRWVARWCDFHKV